MRRPATLITWLTAVSLALVVGLAVVPVTASASPVPAPVTDRAAPPDLRVRTVVGGLQNPWDVQSIGGGRLLVTERDRARLSLVQRGKRRTVRLAGARVWVSGETGLMSMAVDPRFATNRRIWTCQGWRAGGRRDVRVTAWKLNRTLRRAKIVRHVVTGLPATSGRHGGCRLLLDAESDALYVGTGDAADPSNPRDLTSLGGKVLRVHRRTGAPMPGNPFVDAGNARQRLVFTYGHRNVQGLAQRADGSIVSVEHGSDRDDEVNLLEAGGDYGWAPGPGYDESVPMTDQSLPGEQVEALWSSGSPTVATSGAAWTRGSRWGAYADALAVAALKGSRLLLVRFDDARLVDVHTPAKLRRFGRLRSVTSLPGGDLLVTTSNGSRDRVLRVSPR